MGWAQAHTPGPGTTQQIEDAHRKLNELDVPRAPLAQRTLMLAEEVERSRTMLDAELTIRDLEMKIRDGKLTLNVVGGEEGGTWVYRMLAAILLNVLLGDENEEPPNYRGCEWTIKPGGEFEGMRVCAEVMRGYARSSHEIRRDIEAELAQLKGTS